MPVPDYQTVMLPLLRLAGDGKVHSVRETVSTLADEFDLTEEDKNQLLPSGKQRTFDNRVRWARTYLQKAGLLDNPQRGHFQITDRGQEILSRRVQHIDVHFLQQFDEFRAFRDTGANRSNGTASASEAESWTESKTPEELLEVSYQSLRENLAAEVLTTVKECSPDFFERLVVDLLVRMGYGGSHKEAGQAVGRSGDEGVDGIINEDRLGLDNIYVQAKRWDAPVGRPEIQKFAGALQGHRARKGIFITTSSFTSDAQSYVAKIDSRIILIDGARLANYMIDHDVGVAPVATYDLKRIDTDYFTEE